MGRKLDLSGLTDSEAEHVLQVVQRDMRLRKKEEERLSELKQELDAEGSRCLLLSRQSCFNQRCCIRCCAPFTFLLNPKRPCRDCRYNICKACRVYNKRDKAWLCSACQKSRLLKTQSLEWFYTNVKRRFKRFGSAKVLKTLYRKHLAEHSALSELTDGSAYEESICNEGSVCGSDSTFYRQSEEHSMTETLTVALRVAEEAIDEAITNAECDTANQGKQNEANYLREHREELIEELAKTIVQKIITRRKTLAEMKDDYDQEWSLNKQETDLLHHHQTTGNQCCNPFKTHHLRRSHSAFSLLDNDLPGLIQEPHQAFKKEGSSSTMSTWKSVDRLDNAGVSSVLKSPDGNWIALQSAQLSRPSLLTKRKSLVYSALEKESRVVSAYEGMGSDTETKPERDETAGTALQEVHGKMTDSEFDQDSGHKYGRDDLFSDCEGNWKRQSVDLKRKGPADRRRPSPSPRMSIIDMNFNVEGAAQENTVAAQADTGKVKRSKKKSKKRNKREPAASSPRLDDNKFNQSQHSSDVVTSDTWASDATQPDPSNLESGVLGEGASLLEEELALKQMEGGISDSCTGDQEIDEGGHDAPRAEETGESVERHEEEERTWRMDIDLDDGQTDNEKEEEDQGEELDDEMKRRLYSLIAQSRLTYLSSTDEELDRAGLSEGEQGEDAEEEECEGLKEEKTDGLAHTLCQLEEEVHASQLSSTEDELDRASVQDEERTEEEEEELAIRVCRLVNQVSVAQFSSTEDELDRVGCGEEEGAVDEVMLWRLQEEKAAQVRDLASLVSASQFSSTEDELQRVGENEGEGEVDEEREVRLEALESSGEPEEVQRRDGEETAADSEEESLERRYEGEAAEKGGGTNEAENKDSTQEAGTGHQGTAGALKVAQESCETPFKTTEAEEEEIMGSYEMGFTQENQPEAKLSDKKDEEEEENEKGRGEDTARRNKGSQGIWGAVTDSEEEDEEFDRIISSMLMMTLENTEGGTLKVEAATGRAKKAEPENGESQAGELPSQGSLAAAEEEEEGEQQERASSETISGVRKTAVEDAEQSRIVMEDEQQPMELQEYCGSTEAKDQPEHIFGPGSSPQEGLLSPEEIQNDSDLDLYRAIQFISSVLEQRYSAVSLRNITTEVLKVLNATEDLLQGVEGGEGPQLSPLPLPPNTDPHKLDQQFCKLEENVYVAAGTVYRLEEELSDLEECARGISSTTPDLELSFLEEQVASAAAKVQQSELQISDISARIAALKNAGLDVDPQSRFNKTKTIPIMPVTLDSSRQLRRRLPAPPVKEDKET